MKRVLATALLLLASCTGGAAADPDSADVPRAGDLDTWIDLSGDARPLAVLCPDQPGYREAAQVIAEAIEKLGVPRPAVSCDPGTATPETHHVVALGNVNNNRLIARLYFNGRYDQIAIAMSYQITQNRAIALTPKVEYHAYAPQFRDF
ncbi:MAG TPA: hypothetical protein VMY37_00640 [Thermoguttaceae bacterium]|nr:hypothetical protein [Thermoguttaceae bacterium]